MAFVNQIKRNEIESVTMTFDRNELRLLCTVLNRVGGSPENSPRKYANQIVDALGAQGVFLEDYAFKAAVDSKNGYGAVYFKDNSI